jgi:hypothetical protein
MNPAPALHITINKLKKREISSLKIEILMMSGLKINFLKREIFMISGNEECIILIRITLTFLVANGNFPYEVFGGTCEP